MKQEVVLQDHLLRARPINLLLLLQGRRQHIQALLAAIARDHTAHLREVQVHLPEVLVPSQEAHQVRAQVVAQAEEAVLQEARQEADADK